MGQIRFDRGKFDLECENVGQIHFDLGKFDFEREQMGQIRFGRGMFDFEGEKPLWATRVDEHVLSPGMAAHAQGKKNKTRVPSHVKPGDNEGLCFAAGTIRQAFRPVAHEILTDVLQILVPHLL